MAVFIQSWAFDFGILIIFIISFVYLFYQRKYNFWKKLKVAHTNPKFPFGDIGVSYFTIGLHAVLTNIYNSYKSEKVVGFWSFYSPFLLIRDLDVVKDVLVKDFMSFGERGGYVDEVNDPLFAHNLLAVSGAKWKFLRTAQSPAFTPNKMKTMFSIFMQHSEVLVKNFVKFADKGKTVDIKDHVFRFMADGLASCGFGIELDSSKNSENAFIKNVRKPLEATYFNALRVAIRFHPKLFRFFKIKMFDSTTTKFFLNEFKEIIDYRKANNIKLNDIMQLLVQLMDEEKINDFNEIEGNSKDIASQQLSFNEVVAQAVSFFLGGLCLGHPSTAVQFALYELALNPDLQDAVQMEIKSVLAEYNNQITFEGINKMELLGRIVDETLRKYPPLMIPRVCKKDYRINGTDIIVPNGTTVFIPVHAIHFDPVHYPNPHLFDPDRFKEEIKSKRHPYAYLPFGKGPRSCIGIKLASMQIRAGLTILLSSFKFEVCEKTPVPLVFDPKAAVLTPKKCIHLKVVKLR